MDSRQKSKKMQLYVDVWDVLILGILMTSPEDLAKILWSIVNILRTCMTIQSIRLHHMKWVSLYCDPLGVGSVSIRSPLGIDAGLYFKNHIK